MENVKINGRVTKVIRRDKATLQCRVPLYISQSSKPDSRKQVRGD